MSQLTFGACGRRLLNLAVHVLRSALGDAAIASRGDGLLLNPTRVTCDLHELRAAIAADAPERIVQLHTGTLLDGFHLAESAEFANGLTEDVIAHLSKIRALKVISRNSVMAFKGRQKSLKEIGGALGAATVLDDPRGSRSRATLGWAYFFTGRRQEGVAELECAVALSSRNSLWPGQLGQAYAMAGETSKARAILRELEERAQRTFVSPRRRWICWSVRSPTAPGQPTASRARSCSPRFAGNHGFAR